MSFCLREGGVAASRRWRPGFRLGCQRELVSDADVDGGFVRAQPLDDIGFRSSRRAAGTSRDGLGGAHGPPDASCICTRGIFSEAVDSRAARWRVRPRSDSSSSFLPAPPLSRGHCLLLLGTDRGGSAGVRWPRRGSHRLDLSWQGRSLRPRSGTCGCRTRSAGSTPR